MSKPKLRADSLVVESFVPSPEVRTARLATPGDGCICDMAPCGCTRAHDCTQETQ